MVGKRFGCGKCLGSCCVVVGCSMRTGTNLLSKVKMYCFPKDPERLNAWMVAVRRKDWRPTRNSRICNRHFITGRPSLKKNDPDWAPSVALSGDAIGTEEKFAHAMRELINSRSQHESILHCSSSFNEHGYASSQWKEGLSSPALQQISSLEDEIEKLQKERQQKQHHLDCLQLTVEGEKQLTKYLQQDLLSVQDICKNLKNKQQNLLKHIQNQDCIINNLEGQLDQAKTQNSQAEEMAEIIKQHDKELSEITKMFSESTTELIQLRGENKSLKSSLKECQALLKQYGIIKNTEDVCLSSGSMEQNEKS